MPTIIRKDGFRIVIYPNDHIPSHVHVLKNSGEVRIDLGSLEPLKTPSLMSVIGEISDKDIAKALSLVQKHQIEFYLNGVKFMMSENISAELQAEIDRAREVGVALDASESRAVKAWYAADTERIFIELNTEVVMGFPYQQLQGLRNATPKQLAEVEITPTGYGLHWESLDVDLGVPQLVAGLFRTKAWMAELGRQGGKSKSAAKKQASRNNGSLGGRPRKKPAISSNTDELLNMREIASTE